MVNWSPPFVGFPKIARLSREVIVTEKIDGTNAQILVSDDGSDLVAGSRTTWLTPERDNHGFAKWVQANREELLRLGPGRHFGEWWGSGINLGYGLAKGEKRFSLFNVHRWGTLARKAMSSTGEEYDEFYTDRPACCHAVPVLWRGSMDHIERALGAVFEDLRQNGSRAAPGFMRPEGVVVFHTAANICFKKTLDGDGQPKTLAKESK